MKRFVVLLAACLTAGVAAGADASTDPLSWLGRISSAAHKLNYTGTFSYQSGKNVETSRIAHLVDGGAEFEKLEALDGSPREVVRNNEEVQCFLPDQKLVIVDQSAARRGFPARLPSSPSALAENYRIRKGEVVRIAGLESQQIILEPKDDMRFGHQFWADVNSGLLLRARLIGEKGESIEQFAFNEVQIGALRQGEGQASFRAGAGLEGGAGPRQRREGRGYRLDLPQLDSGFQAGRVGHAAGAQGSG